MQETVDAQLCACSVRWQDRSGRFSRGGSRAAEYCYHKRKDLRGKGG